MLSKTHASMVAILAISLIAPAAMAADLGGKAAYEKQCASCHGPDGKGNAAMTKVFGEKQLNIATKEVADKKDEDLIKVMTEGKGKMPASGKALSPADQKAVAAHVKSLAK
jgi:cytochrome c oxidase cbb3-type subunit III